MRRWVRLRGVSRRSHSCARVVAFGRLGAAIQKRRGAHVSSQGQLGCPRVAYPMTTIEKTLTLIRFVRAGWLGGGGVWGEVGANICRGNSRRIPGRAICAQPQTPLRFGGNQAPG